MIIIWIIVAILMFMLIVIIHELWHFLAARFFWVKVEEFWIWIPPKAKYLFTDTKWTQYTLNWLPLWGFVRLKWENETSPLAPLLKLEGEKEDKFSDKNYFAKSIILLGGIFMNFLLAIIIFSILFFVWVKPIWINSQIKTDLDIKIIPTQDQALESWLLKKEDWIVLYPIKNSIAEKSWIKKWDILLRVNNKKINLPKKLIKYISENPWKEINFKINRNNKIFNLIIIPLPLGELRWGHIWAYLSENIILNKEFKYKYSFLDSIKYWTLETYNQTLLTFEWIWILWQKIFNPKTEGEREEAIWNLKWPIWIVDLVSHSISSWLVFLLIISAIISINLWVFNLLPIPALDWWRLFLLTINTFIKKLFWNKINTNNFENSIHIIFFMILIALSLFIWYNDIRNIINR